MHALAHLLQLLLVVSLVALLWPERWHPHRSRVGAMAWLVFAMMSGVVCGLEAQTITVIQLAPGDSVLVIGKGSTPPPPVNWHEPPGMTAQINTGHITPASVTYGTSGSYQTLTLASPIPATWTNFSPTTTSATGENRANLQVTASGGFTVVYPTTTAGGNSPVRFGTGIPGKGTGTLYYRERVYYTAYIAPSAVNGVKMWEPRTSYQCGSAGACENHVIGGRSMESSTTTSQPMVLLQGPNNQSRNLLLNTGGPPWPNVADGAPHTVEMVFTPESPAGAGNGGEQEWIDGQLVAQYTNVQWLAPGQTGGWPYWMCDPTYGGAPATVHPPHQWSITHDSIYVSTK